MIFDFLKAQEHGGVTPTSYFRNKDGFIGADDEWIKQRINIDWEILSQPNLSRSDREIIIVDFGFIAQYYASKGTIKCFDSLQEGWYLIKKGVLYDYWNHKGRMRLTDFWDENSRNKVGFLGEVTELKNILGAGFILAPIETFDLFDLVIKQIETQYISWNDDDFYPEYLVRLYSMLQKKSEWKSLIARPRRRWNHPFRDIFEHWNNETKLARDITAMLDYHVKWNSGFSQNHRSEFDSHFTMINPFELHVLEHVRSQLGLTTPKVDHILTQSPFYPFPDIVKNISSDEIYAKDELLRKFVEKNRDWCNGLNDEYKQLDIETTYVKETNNLSVSTNMSSKDGLSCEKSRLRAYIFSMDKFREYFGYCDLSIIETLNIPSYLSVGNIDFKRGLTRFLEGRDAEPNRPVEEYISAWEIICNHVGQRVKIDEFTNLGVISADFFASILAPIEFFPDIDNIIVFVADFEMIRSIVESMSIQPNNNSSKENKDDTGLGLGLLFQLSGLVQSFQDANTNNQYCDQDLQKAAVGLTSLLIQAYKQKKDIIIFFDQNQFD